MPYPKRERYHINNGAMGKLRALYVMAHDKSCTNGEKANAQTLLARLLKKYDIAEAEIAPQEMEFVSFIVNDRYELSLLGQLYGYVCQASQFEYRRKGKQIWLELTGIQADEMRRLFAAHRKALNRELDLAAYAYYHRNRLFGNGKAKPLGDITETELEKIYKVLKRANLMSATAIPEKRAGRLLK